MHTSSTKAQSQERSTDARREPAPEAARPPWVPRSLALEDVLIDRLAEMARFLLCHERVFSQRTDDDHPGARSSAAGSA